MFLRGILYVALFLLFAQDTLSSSDAGIKFDGDIDELEGVKGIAWQTTEDGTFIIPADSTEAKKLNQLIEQKKKNNENQQPKNSDTANKSSSAVKKPVIPANFARIVSRGNGINTGNNMEITHTPESVSIKSEKNEFRADDKTTGIEEAEDNEEHGDNEMEEELNPFEGSEEESESGEEYKEEELPWNLPSTNTDWIKLNDDDLHTIINANYNLKASFLQHGDDTYVKPKNIEEAKKIRKLIKSWVVTALDNALEHPPSVKYIVKMKNYMKFPLDVARDNTLAILNGLTFNEIQKINKHLSTIPIKTSKADVFKLLNWINTVSKGVVTVEENKKNKNKFGKSPTMNKPAVNKGYSFNSSKGDRKKPNRTNSGNKVNGNNVQIGDDVAKGAVVGNSGNGKGVKFDGSRVQTGNDADDVPLDSEQFDKEIEKYGENLKHRIKSNVLNGLKSSINSQNVVGSGSKGKPGLRKNSSFGEGFPFN